MKNVMILLLLTICSILTINAQSTRKSVKKGATVEKQLDLAAITQFDLAINKANVYVKTGAQQAVLIKGQATILEQINTEVIDGNWRITLPESVKKHKYISIYITLPKLESVTNSSGGQIVATGQFQAAHDLKIEMTEKGTGEIRLDGRAYKVYVRNSGIGVIDMSNFITTDCEVQIIGRGVCKVHPKSVLNTNIVGGGRVIYRTGR